MEDEKKVDETTTPASEETNAEETNSDAVSKNEAESKEESSEGVDYKAELEAELAKKDRELKQAQHTIVSLKKKSKEVEEEDDESETEAPESLTKADIVKLLAERDERLISQTRQTTVRSLIRASTGSEDEAKLALHHYENTIRVTGDDEIDVQNAIALANKARYQNMMNEVRLSKQSRDSKGSGSGAGQKLTKDREIKMTPQEKAWADSMGLTPEEVKKALG